MQGIIIGPDGGGGGVYTLVAEDGEAMYSHYCSSSGFAMGDLYGHRPERKEMFDKKGITEVVHLADSKLTKDELLARNKEWFDKHEKQSNDTNKPECKITTK